MVIVGNLYYDFIYKRFVVPLTTSSVGMNDTKFYTCMTIVSTHDAYHETMKPYTFFRKTNRDLILEYINTCISQPNKHRQHILYQVRQLPSVESYSMPRTFLTNQEHLLPATSNQTLEELIKLSGIKDTRELSCLWEVYKHSMKRFPLHHYPSSSPL